jgi:hypothetical protein
MAALDQWRIILFFNKLRIYDGIEKYGKYWLDYKFLGRDMSNKLKPILT